MKSNVEKIKPFNYEPKKINRFVVNFPKEFEIESWMVQKINKPRFEKNGWQDIEIDFIDTIAPSTSQKLFKLISLKNNKKFQFVDLFKKYKKPMFEFTISAIDPTGVEVEKWIIFVNAVVYVDFSEFNYDDDNITQLKMILKPLDCVLLF
jgi:hypothetical protein